MRKHEERAGGSKMEIEVRSHKCIFFSFFCVVWTLSSVFLKLARVTIGLWERSGCP